MKVLVTANAIADPDEWNPTRLQIFCQYERDTFTVQKRINEIAGCKVVEMKTNPNNGEVYLDMSDFELWNEHMLCRVSMAEGGKYWIDLD